MAIAYADYAWGQSTKDAFAGEIKKNGGEVVGTLGIPLGNTELTPFLSKITGQFDGIFGIFFGPQGIAFVNQAYDLGLSKKYKIAGDGAIAVSTNLPAMGAKADGLRRHRPVPPGARRRAEHAVPQALPRGIHQAAQGDRPLRSAARPLRAVELRGDQRARIGMQKSGFRGKEDTQKLIEALEGLEMKEGDDFPQGDKLLRKEDHQAFLREFIFEIQGGKYKILEAVPKEKTLVPPAAASSPERDRRPIPSGASAPTAGAPRPSCAPRGSASASAASPRSTT